MNIGKSIRLCFADSSKKGYELAEFTGASVQSVSNWRTGRTVPLTPQLALIASFFEMKTSEFIALGE